MNVRHVGIYANNLERLIEFYSKTFKFSIMSREIEKGNFTDGIFGEEGIAIDVCKMKTGNNTILELIEYTSEDTLITNDGGRIYDIGRMHIAFTVDNADIINARIVENGGRVISKPIVNPTSIAKVFFARDPEGNFLEIVEEL